MSRYETQVMADAVQVPCKLLKGHWRSLTEMDGLPARPMRRIPHTGELRPVLRTVSPEHFDIGCPFDMGMFLTCMHTSYHDVHLSHQCLDSKSLDLPTTDRHCSCHDIFAGRRDM